MNRDDELSVLKVRAILPWIFVLVGVLLVSARWWAPSVWGEGNSFSVLKDVDLTDNPACIEIEPHHTRCNFYIKYHGE